MPHYKAPDNSLHFIDSKDAARFLPPGCVQITDEEAATLRAQHKPDPLPRADVLADFKARREIYLNRLGGIAGRAARAGRADIAAAADAFAQGLLDLPDHADVAGAVDADLPAAIMAQYRALALAAAATPDAAVIFDKVSK